MPDVELKIDYDSFHNDPELKEKLQHKWRKNLNIGIGRGAYLCW